MKRLDTNKKLKRAERKHRSIVVVWPDSAPSFLQLGIISWQNKKGQGFTLDPYFHVIYQVPKDFT